MAPAREVGLLSPPCCDAVAKPERPIETTGSWFNWWFNPVVTSGAVLEAVVLGFLGLLLAIVGLIFLVAEDSPAVGLLCVVGAIAIGWWGYRRLRRVA